MLPKFAGYTTTDLLHEGGSTVVYRGHHDADGAKVVIKSHRSDHPTVLDIAKLRHEHALLCDLQGPGIIAVRPLVTSGHRLGLVMEDVGLPSLDRRLGAQLDLVLVLGIIAEAAAVLHRAHQLRIVHKDIKPHNLLIGTEPLRIYIIDWAIAARLSEMRQNKEGSELAAEGTLAYLAPEQTGLLDQRLDTRTDLYSLGVTFYELLTGTLPFTEDDPKELVRSHLIRPPRPPHELDQNIPDQVSQIVVKLLAKSAEDRYASARGLELDVRECLAQWERSRRIQPFPLGRFDRSGRFRLRQRLYGRDADVAALHAAFKRVQRGAAELVLVTGSGGIGKSAIVREVRGAMQLAGAHFIAGKFEQFRGALPYATLTQMFGGWVRSIMTEPEHVVSRWRTQFQEALGQNVGVLTQLIPELARIMGQPTAAAEIDLAGVERRFQFAVQQFVSVFTRAEHPLVLFLDDLQWAEPASLKLLEMLLTDPDRTHLLIVGAYRDNEPDSLDLLLRTLDDVASAGWPIGRIELRPLTPAAMDRLIADALETTPEHVEALGEEIYRKTQGNPLFAGQLLESLAHDGHIAFDHDSGRWRWDLGAISRSAVTDNIAELITRRIQLLDSTTQEMLKLGACLGAQFDHATLAELAEQSTSVCAHRLLGAIDAGILVPLHDDYRLLGDVDESPRADVDRGGGAPVPAWGVAYRFLHDRVQEAAYSLIDEQARSRVHLRVARLMHARHAGRIADEDVFTVVDHLNIAQALVTGRSERLAAAELNLRAGRRARATVAYAAARAYLTAAIAYLPEDAWETAHELSFAVRCEHAEIVFLTGEHGGADALFDELLQHTRDVMMEIKVHLMRMRLYQLTYQNEDIMRIGRLALSKLGVSLPETDDECQAELDAGIETVTARLRRLTPEEIVEARPMADPRIKLILRILIALDLAVAVLKPKLSALISIRHILLSMDHGPSELAASGYASYMAMIIRIGQSEQVDQLIQIVASLQERYPGSEYTGRVGYLHAQAFTLTRPPHQAMAAWDRVVQTSLQHGDVLVLTWSISTSLHLHFAADEELGSLLDRLESAYKMLRLANGDLLMSHLDCFRQWILSLQGRTRNLCSFTDDRFDEDAFLVREKRTLPLTAYYLLKFILLYLGGEHEAAMPVLQKLTELYIYWNQLLQAHASFYICLYLCALLETSTATDADRYQAMLDEHHGLLARRRAQCQEHWACLDLLVAAERARLRNRVAEACHLYDHAIDVAQRDGFIRVSALANELCGKLYLKRGYHKVARLYLSGAHQDWLRWGAVAKADALAAQFADYVAPLGPEQPISKFTSSITNRSSTVALKGVLFDLGEVMRATHAISYEISVEHVIEHFLRTSNAIAAAARALVILVRGDDLLIAGKVTANSDVRAAAAAAPLAGSAELSESVVRYVARSHEAVILDKAHTSSLFVDDPYLRDHRPKALICLPLIHQDILLGVWYAEIDTAGRLRRGLIDLLQMLASHAASAIQNARLYEQLQATSRELSTANERLESVVATRTAELRRETEQLREAQARLVKLERLTTEVQMAGGFAHEMRNALASANLRLARVYKQVGGTPTFIGHDTTEQLKKILLLMQEYLPANAFQRMTSFMEGVRDNEQQIATAFDGISSSIERSLRVTALILDYSRIGAELPGKEPFVLKEVVEDVVQGFAMDFSQNGISVVIEVEPHIILLGDKRHFSSILNNLVENACDALLLTKKLEREMWIKCVRQAEGDVVLNVVDHGVGIAPEHRAKVFEPFFSTKPSTGTGLGLGFVEKLVSLYGGSIEIESEVDQGTTVSIWLPRSVSPDTS